MVKKEKGLAGTTLSSPIFGSVHFDLTFFNEVSKSHETIKSSTAASQSSSVDPNIDPFEWNTDPFEYPDRVDRESPEELVAHLHSKQH